VLIGARLLGGLSAGMAYPTTLALITALWWGAARTRSIALWSALGGAISSLGPLTAGALLEDFWWGSVFVITLPLAVVALALVAVPALPCGGPGADIVDRPLVPVNDYLVRRGIEVLHILAPGASQPHQLSRMARIAGDCVIYPPEQAAMF